MYSFVSEHYPAPFFPFKGLSNHFLLQTSFEWVRSVDIVLVVMLSGVHVYVCACVFNHDACPLSVLETTFYGRKYTSQVTIWQPRGTA